MTNRSQLDKIMLGRAPNARGTIGRPDRRDSSTTPDLTRRIVRAPARVVMLATQGAGRRLTAQSRGDFQRALMTSRRPPVSTAAVSGLLARPARALPVAPDAAGRRPARRACLPGGRGNGGRRASSPPASRVWRRAGAVRGRWPRPPPSLAAPQTPLG